MEKKKILILANSVIGLYKFRKELLEELIKEDYSVVISCPNDNQVFKDSILNMGIEFIDTEIDRRGMNPLKDMGLFLNYLRIMKRVKPNKVLTYTIKPNLYGGIACRFNRVKNVPNITGMGSSSKNEGILRAIIIVLYKLALKKASCVFFQNEENMNYFKNNKIIKGRYELIPGSGVNVNEYEVLDYPKENIINFLFIGRVMREKGIEEFLKAAKYFHTKNKKINFHIIGACEEDYTDILEKMNNKGTIIYHGLQNNITDFHKMSNCTIHPTFYPEGMSNVLLESAACGRPIITTNRTGCKEIIEDNINGFLVKERDSKDLIKKIEKFIKLTYEEKKQMGLNGRKKIEKEFDRQIVVEEYMKEIKCVHEL